MNLSNLSYIMTHICLFASGSGTNAENISEYFADSSDIAVSLIVTNRKNAGVIPRSEKLGVPLELINTGDENYQASLMEVLDEKQIDFIVLAGYLNLIPSNLIKHYPNAIINIHPALLPKYGGKGMYGTHVHNAVIQSQEEESGITVHYVNEKFDEGRIIMQARCPVFPDDSPESLAQRVHALEYLYYPVAIKQCILNLSK